MTELTFSGEGTLEPLQFLSFGTKSVQTVNEIEEAALRDKWPPESSGNITSSEKGGGGHAMRTAVYTPIEAIKFSSFRLRVSNCRGDFPEEGGGNCIRGTRSTPAALALSIRPDGLSLLPGLLIPPSVGLRFRLSRSVSHKRAQRKQSREIERRGNSKDTWRQRDRSKI